MSPAAAAGPAVSRAVALLLGGTAGRMGGEVPEASLVDALVARRLAPEVAALPAAAGLSRAARLRLEMERERTRVLAESRRKTLETCRGALEAAGVPAMLLKGEAVVALTHGDASRRPMADLDLLVAPERRADASRALEAAGLVRPGADTPLHDVFLDPASAAPGLRRGTAVEVHVDVFARPHPFAVDAPGALERATRGRAGLHAPELRDALALTAFSLGFHETDGRKTWMVLRDLSLLASAATGRAMPEGRAPLGAAEAAVAGRLLALADAWTGPAAGARAWLDVPGAPTWRQRTAARWLLRELEATLHEAAPGERRLTRRVTAALWPDSLVTSLAALARGVLAPGGGGMWARARRLADGVRRARRERGA